MKKAFYEEDFEAINTTNLTAGELNQIEAYRDLVVNEKLESRHDALERFLEEFGPMTEADLVKKLQLIGYGKLFDKGTLAARLDECRARRGSLTKGATIVSESTGKRGCLWVYVPPNAVERATARVRHWQDALSRDLRIKTDIDPRVENDRAELTVAENVLRAAKEAHAVQEAAALASPPPRRCNQNLESVKV